MRTRRKNVKFRLHDRAWTIAFGCAEKTDGIPNDALCNWTDREITVNPDHKSSLLNCVAHELLHAYMPTMSEESVNEYANILAEIYPKMVVLHPSN